MQVLNRNQRRSAIWRIISLMGVLLLILFTCGFSINKAFNNTGNGQFIHLQDSLQSLNLHYDSLLVSLKQDSVAYLDTLREVRSNENITELKIEKSNLDEKFRKEQKKVKKIIKSIANYEKALKDCSNSQTP